MNRVEILEYPIPALREMILNALIHRNYMGAPTQLRMYDKKLFLWNHGTLPEGITLAELTETHSSFPRNPILAEACFKGGYIDSWGSGTIKILNVCNQIGFNSVQMNIITIFLIIYNRFTPAKINQNSRSFQNFFESMTSKYLYPISLEVW